MEHFNPKRSKRQDAIGALSLESRGGLRLNVELEATLSGTRVGRRTVELWDLSATGCRIACVSNYPSGTNVIITIPGLSAIGAQVRWSDVAFCGLQFNAPLHSLVVDDIVGRARRQP